MSVADDANFTHLGISCFGIILKTSILHFRDLPVDPRTLLGSVDIRETDKDFQFLVDVPGLTKDDVKVRVSADGVLTIEGERKVGHFAACLLGL